jgi:hypothetical protein
MEFHQLSLRKEDQPQALKEDQPQARHLHLELEYPSST